MLVIPTTLPVTDDSAYLREDDDIIHPFLENRHQEPLLTVHGCRRSGKTSFLYKIQRKCSDRNVDVLYLSFDQGPETVLDKFGDYLGTSLSHDRQGVESLTRQLENGAARDLVILVDEPMMGLFGEESENRVLPILMRRLLALIPNRMFGLVLAEIPTFYQKCLNQEGLQDLSEHRPQLLKPISTDRKEKLLHDTGGDLLVQAGERIGNIPIEVANLCASFCLLTDPSEGEILNQYSSDMELAYQGMYGSLSPEEQALLQLAAWGDCHENALNSAGKSCLQKLDAQTGSGFLRKKLDGSLLVVSEPLGEQIRSAYPPNLSSRKMVLLAASIQVQPDGEKTEPGTPTPTFFPEFIIHQVADLHFGKFGRQRSLAKPDEKHVAYNYLNHLKNLSGKKRPHVIVICGDLSSTGDKEEFEQAGRFIQQLAIRKTITGEPLLQPLFEGSEPDARKQIFLVPGNHDLKWGDNPDTSVRNEFFSHFQNHVEAVLPIWEGRNRNGVNFKAAGISIITLNSAYLTGEFLAQIEEKYKEKQISRELRDELYKLHEILEKALSELFDRINSKTAERVADEQNLLQLISGFPRFKSGCIRQDVLVTLREDGIKCFTKLPVFPKISVGDIGGHHRDIKIAVCHHNLSSYHGTALFSDLINSGEVKSALMAAGVDILLHGHLHQPVVTSEFDHQEARQRLHLIGCGTLGALDEIQTFNEIRIKCQESGSGDTTEHRRVTIKQYHCLKPADHGGKAWDKSRDPLNLEII